MCIRDSHCDTNRFGWHAKWSGYYFSGSTRSASGYHYHSTIDWRTNHTGRTACTAYTSATTSDATATTASGSRATTSYTTTSGSRATTSDTTTSGSRAATLCATLYSSSDSAYTTTKWSSNCECARSQSTTIGLSRCKSRLGIRCSQTSLSNYFAISTTVLLGSTALFLPDGRSGPLQSDPWRFTTT